MAPRPYEEALSAVLGRNHFRFMNRHGEITLAEIYQAVKERYSMLCDDTYLCPHYRSRSPQPEWKHTVRGVLDTLKKKGVITNRGNQIWIFP